MEWACGELEVGGLYPKIFRFPPIANYMEKWCSYLFSMKKNSGDDYQPWVVVQYLSSFKTVLFKRFKPLGYIDESPSWYTDLYHGLRLKACNACLARGGRLSKKAIGFAKDTLRECCLYLLMHRDNQEQAVEERAVLTTLYHAVGRGGEVALSAWENLYWDDDRQHLAMDWGELKTSSQCIMTFHPDANDWVLDEIHSLACYALANPSATRSSTAEANITYMFPAYASLSNVSKKVSKILDKCRKSDDNPHGVESIPPEAASHSIRVSSFNEALFGSTFIEAVSRGGWGMEGDTTAFHYVMQPLHIAKAGKTLAGWRYSDQHVTAPTLSSILNESNRDKVFAFVGMLFHESEISALLNGELKEVRDLFAASLLMYYEPVLDKLTDNCFIIKRIHNAASMVHVDFTQIKEWGEIIRSHFIVANAQNLGGIDDCSEEERQKRINTILQETCSKLLITGQSTNAKVDRIEKKVDNSHQLLLEMKHLIIAGAGGRGDDSGSASAAVDGTLPPVTPSPSSDEPKNAFDAMTRGQIIMQTYDWTNLANWSVSKFVIAITRSQVDAASIQDFLKNNGLNGSKSSLSTLRTRAKKMIGCITDCIPETEKMYVDYRQCPRVGDHQAFLQWSDTISKLGSTWSVCIINNLFSRYKCALEKLQGNDRKYGILLSKAETKKKNTKLLIGSLAGVLEEIEKFERLAPQTV